jgi:class 3 adenylate cyclase
MPDMNGIELLARLKADTRWRDIPVIMVSGLKETKAVVRCIAAGAEDYLQKPIDAVLLHSRVNACLERIRWHRREKQFLARIEYERDRADTLLHAMLPAPVILRLQAGETVIADRFDSATIVFADIVDFTPLVARTDPPHLLRQLAAIFSAFDDLSAEYGIEKIKTIGDAYMAVAGVPDPREDHAERALGFARALIATMAGEVGQGLAIRVGLHTGPVIAGLVGRLRFVYDVWGETVNLASRLEASGQPGRIHVSEASHGILSHAARCPEARMHELKGLGRVRTFLID